MDERAAPEPCRLNGFTLSFHVAEPALAEASLSRDDWLGGEAPELGDLYSFCFEAPVDSVCHNHSINQSIKILTTRTVSIDSGAEGLGLKSQPRCCFVTVLGKLFTPFVPLFTKQ